MIDIPPIVTITKLKPAIAHNVMMVSMHRAVPTQVSPRLCDRLSDILLFSMPIGAAFVNAIHYER